MIYNSYQIAEIIGVNVSTVKRWTDSGRLKCAQSIGGHRKFQLNDIKDFLRKNKKISTSVNINLLVGENNILHEAISNLDFNYINNYAYKALKKGNDNKFSSLINSLILKNYLYSSIFDNLIIPLLHRIGIDWVNKKISIAEEHMICEILKKFLCSTNYQYQITEAKYNAFCFTMENDSHDLPLHLAETILNQIGTIKTYNLGTNLPIKDFLKVYDSVKPQIIFISIIYYKDAAWIKSQINELYQSILPYDTRIFIRGAGAHLIRPEKNIYLIKSFHEFSSILIDTYNN
jgi:excisionase family DNA binding protein|tara:strand:- start:1826 stop:2692 length:867 start_codon:yes stop_codon:yes gene_type:complete